MSYDFTLEIDTGGAEPAVIEESNLPWSIREALIAAFGCQVSDLSGRPAGHLLDGLHAAADAHPGNEHLAALERMCRRHPKATLRVL